MSFRSLLRFAAAAALLTPALAHTWVEQLQLINPDTGNYTGDFGYPRGYVSRTNPGFNGFSNMLLLPPLESGRTRIDNTDLLCHPAQRVANQTDNFPALKATPGSWVAIKYLENGHVTLPNNQKGKPESGGTVYIFGTTEPKADEKIVDVLAWTKDGKGGDGRGRLLTAQNYDDGRCYQINGGDISTKRQKDFPNRIPGQPESVVEQWCEADVQVPEGLDAGKTLTVYYIWDWPTIPGQDPILQNGKDEFYTTCMDINLSDVKIASAGGGAAKFKLDQQDPQVDAVANFMSRTAVSGTYSPRSTGYVTETNKSSSANANRQGGQIATAAPAPSTLATSARPSSCQQATVTVTAHVTHTVYAKPSKRNRGNESQRTEQGRQKRDHAKDFTS